jgi:ribosome-binding protein aMBF1 (putative translation factor)
MSTTSQPAVQEKTNPPTAPSVDDAIGTIRAYVRHRGWSIYRLAQESGLQKTTLRDFHEPAWNPKTETLRILYALIPAGFNPATARPAPPIEDRRRTRRPSV